MSDLLSANAIAGIICRSAASRAAFIEHAFQESLAIIEANKPVVLALARALIEHPAQTLNTTEINLCIAGALAREASDIEHVRRTGWAKALENAGEFSAELER